MILVDWSAADSYNYISSRVQVAAVGQLVAAMVAQLVTAAGMELADLHLVGHSLGAHIMGFAGRTAGLGSAGKGRITGECERVHGVHVVHGVRRVLLADWVTTHQIKRGTPGPRPGPKPRGCGAGWGGAGWQVAQPPNDSRARNRVLTGPNRPEPPSRAADVRGRPRKGWQDAAPPTWAYGSPGATSSAISIRQ